MEIPTFDTKKELFDFLVTNKNKLIAAKKAVIKHADGVVCNAPVLASVNKQIEDSDELRVKAVINTANFLDSHMDVHIPGLWNKSLSENKNLMHLQEHKMAFNSIISDGEDLKATAESISWKDLGYNWEGKTEALIFDSLIRPDRNKYMHEQYQKNRVKNHSVGMYYVRLILAVNDESYGAEFEAWEKYYTEIINPEAANEKGFFWAVREAKVIEGSAVPIGSNTATPTLEPKLFTQELNNEPPVGTQEFKQLFRNELKTIFT